jgi:CRISPR-associated protein Cas4
MPLRITVSMLSAYSYCKRKLFLEKVFGLFEPEKEALVKGTIRHATYDKVNKVEESLVKTITDKDNFDTIYERYLNTYSKLLRDSIAENKYRLSSVKLDLLKAYHQILPFFRTESEIRAKNIIKFIEANNIYGEELWNKLIPKISSEFAIESENLELKGIIDQIEQYPAGSVPIELKTGKAPENGIWPSHKIQLGAYALLMEEKFKTPINEGFVVYLDTRERRHIQINPFLKQEVKDLKEKVKLLLTNKQLPDIESNENKCAKCGLKDKCHNKELMQTLLKKLEPSLSSEERGHGKDNN